VVEFLSFLQSCLVAIVFTDFPVGDFPLGRKAGISDIMISKVKGKARIVVPRSEGAG
jgi:hypothetical protein